MDDEPGGAGFSSHDPAEDADIVRYFKCHHMPLIGFAHALLMRWDSIPEPKEVACNCVQEAFARLVEARYLGANPFATEIADPDHVRGWLFLTTKNLVKMELRERARHPRMSLNALFDNRGFDLGDDGIEDTQVDIALVEALLRGLTPRERTIMERRFRDDLTGEQIAEQLRISHTAERQAARRALNKLKKRKKWIEDRAENADPANTTDCSDGVDTPDTADGIDAPDTADGIHDDDG